METATETGINRLRPSVASSSHRSAMTPEGAVAKSCSTQYGANQQSNRRNLKDKQEYKAGTLFQVHHDCPGDDDPHFGHRCKTVVCEPLSTPFAEVWDEPVREVKNINVAISVCVKFVRIAG